MYLMQRLVPKIRMMENPTPTGSARRFLRRNFRALTILFLGVMASGCRDSRFNEDPKAMDAALKMNLQTLATGRIFFAHQSVGENVLEGVSELLADSGAPALAIVDVNGTDSLPTRGYILHTKIGQNKHPDSKCADFGRILEEKKNLIDVAILKYCFEDVENGQDAQTLFSEYQGMLTGLRKHFPSITIIPATIPLTANSGFPNWQRSAWHRKARLFFGLREGEEANIKRNQFNALLLEANQGKPIFDIAKIESTYPDGSQESFRKGSETYYALIEEYTNDGGHLNAMARKIAAREFIDVVASVLQKRARIR